MNFLCERINTETDHVSSFGFVGKEKNKWQGAQLAKDKILYAIPSNAEQILCIDTSGASSDYYIMGNNFTSLKDKWQGELHKSVQSSARACNVILMVTLLCIFYSLDINEGIFI